MKNIVILIAFLFTKVTCGQTSTNTHPEWIINSSSVTFKIKNAGFTVDGSFGKVSAKIIFDLTKNYGNSIEAQLESSSINTGNSTRDGHLKKKEYFDVNSFPFISMKATSFGKEKNGNYKGYFKLTLKNMSKDIVVPFTFNVTDNKAVLNGSFTINRLDFGVGESSIILSNNVTISISVNVIKK